jgi:hypothetical protein
MALNDWMKEIHYTNEVKTEFMRVLMYGLTGTGKTQLLGTFPSPFVIDTDGGLATLRKLNVPFYSFKNPIYGEKDRCQIYSTVMSILDSAERRDKEPFDFTKIKTIGIDGFTRLSMYILREVMIYPPAGGKSKNPDSDKPEFDHWAVLKNRMLTIATRLYDLSNNYHIVGTAWVKTSKNEVTGITEIIPDLDGAYKDKIGHDFDEFFYMMNEGGKFIVRTKPYGKINAKTRWLKVDKIEDANFDKIWELRK